MSANDEASAQPPELRELLDKLMELRPAEMRTIFESSVDAVLGQEQYSAGAVFDRIKEMMHWKSDATLAWFFGVSPQNISNRRKRNSVPFREAVYLASVAKRERKGRSLSYLLTGQEDWRPNSDASDGEPSPGPSDG